MTMRYRETNGRWHGASHHEPRMLEPVVIAVDGAMTATVLTSLTDALVLAGPATAGVCSPVLTLREVGAVLAGMEG